ncbi:hypothetical protein ES703_41914 [subsurface metagenome]
MIFLKPIVTPIGQWMVDWITVVITFLQQNLSSDLTIFIVICVILIVSGIIINIIWPGDIKGTIFSKGKIIMQMYAPYVEPAIKILIFYINNYFLILRSNSATLLPRSLVISPPNSSVSSFSIIILILIRMFY